MSQPDFRPGRSLSLQSQQFIRNPSQRLGYAESRASAPSAKLKSRIGNVRPSTVLSSGAKIGTKIMPKLMKAAGKAAPVIAGFDLANKAIGKLDKGHNWLNPRKAE